MSVCGDRSRLEKSPHSDVCRVMAGIATITLCWLMSPYGLYRHSHTLWTYVVPRAFQTMENIFSQFPNGWWVVLLLFRDALGLCPFGVGAYR